MTDGSDPKTFAAEPLPDGVPDSSSYEIRVHGTKGISFSGSYTTIARDGTQSSRTVEDVVPATYRGSGAMVWVDLQKQTDSGVLAVKVLRGRSIFGRKTTQAAYGVVNLIARLDHQDHFV